MTQDYYTMSDIAKACGISRQAVYKRLSADANLANQFAKAALTIDNRKVYTVDALQALQIPISKPSVTLAEKELQETVKRLTAERDNLQRDLDNQRNEVDRLKKELEAAKQRAESEKSVHETIVTGLNNHIDSLKAEVNRLSDRLDTVHEKHAEQLEKVSTDFADRLTAAIDKLNEQHTEQLTRANQLTHEAHALQAGQLQKDSAQLVTVADDHKPTLWQRLFKRKQ